jgi:hypothetical protein
VSKVKVFVQLVAGCRACPNFQSRNPRQDDCHNTSFCIAMNRDFDNVDRWLVPEWCPLDDAPLE